MPRKSKKITIPVGPSYIPIKKNVPLYLSILYQIYNAYLYINTAVIGANTNKYLLGFSMLMLNIGGKYISVKFHKSTEEYLRYSLSKQIMIFCMVFIGTRDVITALIVTILFLLATDYLFNDESKYCIVPSKYKRIFMEVDENEDGKLTDAEITKALNILKKAKDETLVKSDEIGNIVTFHENFLNKYHKPEKKEIMFR